jgi:hypothetical protein
MDEKAVGENRERSLVRSQKNSRLYRRIDKLKKSKKKFFLDRLLHSILSLKALGTSNIENEGKMISAPGFHWYLKRKNMEDMFSSFSHTPHSLLPSFTR